ncbi:MAG: GNAT family N-acetyltransferase [Asgard group archaeon]|nr:GNAT family N-acetyltransferase [Asgard group archaeon]
MSYLIEIFEPKKASEELWQKYFASTEKMFKEENPKDDLPDRELEKEFMRNPNPYYDIYRWIVFVNEEKEQIIGRGTFWFENELTPNYEEVKDKGYFYFAIEKEYRRKGIGSEIFKLISRKAKECNKNILRVHVTNPSGIDYCQKRKGEQKAERAENRLYLEKVDWELVYTWREEGKKRASEVRLETFEVVSEEDLVEYCELYTEVFNRAPQEDLIAKVVIDPKRRRADEEDVKEKGYKWVTIISREQNGVISGLTEIYYHKANPKEVEQELTGVLEGYQKRGLGKWLKAEMLFYIKEKFPEAEFISTGNNDRNAPMLSINNRMGFERYKTELVFEFNPTMILNELDSNTRTEYIK